MKNKHGLTLAEKLILPGVANPVFAKAYPIVAYSEPMMSLDECHGWVALYWRGVAHGRLDCIDQDLLAGKTEGTNYTPNEVRGYRCGVMNASNHNEFCALKSKP